MVEDNMSEESIKEKLYNDFKKDLENNVLEQQKKDLEKLTREYNKIKKD